MYFCPESITNVLNNDGCVCTLYFYLLTAVGQVTISCMSKVPLDNMLHMAYFHVLLLLSNLHLFPAKLYFPYNSPGKNKSPAHTPMQPALLEGLFEGTLHSSEWRKATAWLESR